MKCKNPENRKNKSNLNTRLMAGPHPSKSSAASAGGDSNRKSRWESSSAAAGKNQASDSKPSAKHNPSPKAGPSASPAPNKQQHGPNHAGPAFPFPDPTAMGPPPPSYGFHMLDRRSIVLYDGSVRSYLALPPEYQDFPTIPVLRDPRFIGGPDFGASPLGFRDNRDYRRSSGLDGPGSMKRKYREEGNDPRVEKEELARKRLGLNPGPNGYPMRPAGGEFPAGPSSNDGSRDAMYPRMVGGFENSATINKHTRIDQSMLQKSFLHFVKLVYENPGTKTNFLENGKQGRLQCLACGRFDDFGLGLDVVFCIYHALLQVASFLVFSVFVLVFLKHSSLL